LLKPAQTPHFPPEESDDPHSDGGHVYVNIRNKGVAHTIFGIAETLGLCQEPFTMAEAALKP